MKKIGVVFLIAAACSLWNSAWSADTDLKFAITGALISDPSNAHSRELAEYIARKVGRTSVLISGLSYGQVDNLFMEGQVDVGFLCNSHYARRKQIVGFEPLAAPVIAGHAGPKFRIYIIVPRESSIAALAGLKGKVVDFADPLSTTSIYAAHELQKQNQTIKSFFKKAMYSGSHDMTVELVAAKMVDGGFIDGHIWDYHDKFKSGPTSKTKIIYKSEKFTAPPVVVSKSLPHSMKRKIHAVMLAMHMDAEGREILKGLNIERFVDIREQDYQDVEHMYHEIRDRM